MHISREINMADSRRCFCWAHCQQPFVLFHLCVWSSSHWWRTEDVWSVCVKQTSMTTEILKTQVSLKTSKMWTYIETMCVCLVSNSVYVGGTCQRWRWMKEPRFPSTTLDWIQMISVIHLTCQWFKVVADQWIYMVLPETLSSNLLSSKQKHWPLCLKKALCSVLTEYKVFQNDSVQDLRQTPCV